MLTRHLSRRIAAGIAAAWQPHPRIAQDSFDAGRATPAM